MKIKVLFLIIVCVCVVSGVSCLKQSTSANNGKKEEQAVVNSPSDRKDDKDLLIKRLRHKAVAAKEYCKNKQLSEQYCILVNFNIHSGRQRFFVWDFEKDTVLLSSLCAHGMGRNSTEEKPEYSNDEGSYCSSLGRYKTGVSSYSQYGINVHYKLHGLDSTNNNAFKRIVVLHSHSPIPDRDISPNHLPLGFSLGCPVISDTAMRKTDALLKESEKPLLLWIYDEC